MLAGARAAASLRAHGPEEGLQRQVAAPRSRRRCGSSGGQSGVPKVLPLVLTAAVLALGSSGVISRAAPLQGVPAMVMAFWRMALSAVVLAVGGLFPGKPSQGGDAPAVKAVDPPRAPGQPSDAVLMSLAGLVTAVYFSFFYASLQRTSILRCYLLVSLVPLFSGFLACFSFLGTPARRPPARFWAGILVALFGVRLTLGGGSEVGAAGGGAAPNLGDVLALLGAVMFALYVRIGRSVRQRVPLRDYQLWVTGTAACLLLPVAWALHGGVSVRRPAWPFIILASLLPQLVGQSGLDFAVKSLPARAVASFTLLEPVSASLLAWAILGEAVAWQSALGAGLVLGGVVLAVSSG